MTFCPKCKRLSEYDSYFERYYCTSCNWRSEKVSNPVIISREHSQALSKSIKTKKYMIAG